MKRAASPCTALHSPAVHVRRAVCALAAALLLAGAAFCISSALPRPAHAVEVETCTAAPNEDGGGRILGATPTRVSWRAHAAEGESLAALQLSLPEGVSVDAAQTRVTAFSGLERVEVNAQAATPSENVLDITFAEPTPAGVSFLVEMYGVTFPGEGGTFSVSATTTAADGTATDLGAFANPIEVSGISVAEQISAWLSDQAWVEAWNSNKFLHLFFDPCLIVTSTPIVFNGWLTALGIVAVSFPCAIPIGFLLALMRMAKLRVLRGIASTYVNIVRGTPMFLQIYIAFFGLPLLGLNVNNFVLGCCVMALNSSAYLCEIFRAGIQSISKGQFEAARSLGMNGAQTMLHVIAPQAFRRVIPTMTNEPHSALQGHFPAGCRGHYGNGHVRQDYHRRNGQHYPLHCGCRLLPGCHAAHEPYHALYGGKVQRPQEQGCH